MRARLASGAARAVRSKAGIIADFQSLCDRFQSSLEREHISLKRLGEHTEFGVIYSDLGAFVNSTVTGIRKPLRRPPPLLRLKHLFAVEAVGGSSPIVSDRYVAAIEFHELPEGAEPEMFAGLSTKVRVPATFHVRYIAQPVAKMKKKFRNARRDFAGASTFETGGGVDPSQIAAAEQMMDATGKATQVFSRFGEVSLAFIVRARTRPLLKEAVDAVISALEDVPHGGYRCSVKRLGAMDLFLSTLPGNLRYGVRRFPLDTLTIAKTVPIHVPDIGRPYAESEALPASTPPTTYALGPGNNQIRYHPNSGGVWHTLTCGHSEKGKSVDASLVSLSMRSRLPMLGVSAVDSGTSLYQLCRLLDGNYYRLGAANALGFALFDHVDEPEEALVVLGIIEEQAVIPKLGIVSPDHHRALVQAMERVAEMPAERRSMLAFYDAITDDDRKLRPIIRKFTRYELGTLVDCEQDSFTAGRFNVVDIRDIIGLPQDVLAFVYRVIIHKCRSQVERLKRRMGAAGRDLHWWYSFDEAHRFFENDLFAQMIVKVLKEGRKDNYSINLISNSVFDFSNFPYRTDLLGQTATRLYYGDPDAISSNPGTLKAYENMGVPDRGVAMLAPMPEHYFLRHKPREGTLQQATFAITKEQLAALGTSRTASLVDEAIAKYGNYEWKVPYLRSRGAHWAADRLEQILREDDYREDKVLELLSIGGAA
jgi:type IV secretory pathway VirB4 component